MNKEQLAAVAMTVITVMEDDHCQDEILENAFILLAACRENRSRVPGRRWSLDRNDPLLFFQYAFCKEFGSCTWEGMFRVNVNMYNVLLSELREDLIKHVTKNFRFPIKPERTLATFLNVYMKRTIYPSRYADGSWSKHSVTRIKTSFTFNLFLLQR